MNVAKRSPAPDLTRIFAFFTVVSVHFFKYTGFYSQAVQGKRMFVMTLMRSFFMICVPLFLTLSGYLLRRKQLEKKYYNRIGKIITTYVLSSLLCVFYSVVFQGKDLSVKDIVLNILKFKAAPYAWYIEMYIGLFLLIPFLNIMYNNLPSQKSKLWLIITFIILTSLPSILNVYDLQSFDWLAMPSSTTTKNKLIPEWWQNVYPITYYFIGCYIGEYGLEIKKGINVLLIIVCSILSGTYCYWRSYGDDFVTDVWSKYQSLFNVVQTVLVFTFFVNINFDKMPDRLAKIIQKISGLCLGGYLVSWIFDKELYPILVKRVPSATDRLEYYIVIVPIIFVLSLLSSYFLSIIQCLIEKGWSLLLGLIRGKTKKTKPVQ